MNLKEFDAKQFLLEKGEQVGLGVALTLMVLMLIFSLFMPSKGFFSGSPAEKAKVLKKGADDLETALRTKPIPDNEKPEPTEGRLTNLDTNFLLPKNYQLLGLFEPAVKESPERRPPRILNIDEGYVADAHVLIDTYLFSSDFKYVWVLRDPDGIKQPKAAPGSTAFSAYNKMQGGTMPRGMGGLPQGLNQLKGPSSHDSEYKATQIPVDTWNAEELTARQPRPLRVAVIGGSFPYRRQLEEFKNRLHLENINAVLNEDLSDKSGKSFDFRGVEVQRMEVDADDKPLTEWSDLALAEHYQNWLKLTYWPLQPENPKYDLIKMDGLVAPLLREFHPDKKVDPTMQMQGMMGRPGMGRPMPPGQNPPEAAANEPKPLYPDVVAKLRNLQDTLVKLSDVQPQQVAVPRTKPGDYKFDPFRPTAGPPASGSELKTANPNEANAAQDFIPEHVLVRAVDVDVQPGKRYRYRLRIKMANPNYMHSDVASPEYKVAEVLKSRQWAEIEQTVSLPPELHYYVVDEKKLATKQETQEITRKKGITAQSRMWSQRNPSTEQAVFQLHRWVEQTPLGKDSREKVPVGQWVVADRVYVARGEFVGRKVKVDLPIWKYMQNAYVLPAEEPKTYRERLLAPTGIEVDFGFNSSSDDTMLVDFEGGRVSGPSKIDDECRTEVLMLSPDGKLRVRNSAKDIEDKERIARREQVLKRVEDVRRGKDTE